MIEVKMPRGAKELRIKHFKAMSSLPQQANRNDFANMLFLSEFLGLRYNQVLDFRPRDVKKMIHLAEIAYAGMDITSELPKEISLKGKKFVLVDPEKIGIGWHIDFKASSIVKDPVGLACLFYVQEGFNYSDVDKNGNITFPIASRRELFEAEFPLDLFVRGANFFLKGSLLLTKKSMVQEIAQSKASNRIALVLKSIGRLSGKRP